MQFHDVANIFPLMDGDEYQSLVADIAEHGQREPIYLHDGKIIDGRNRYRACCDLGLVPEYREWTGDGSLVAFVVSLNLKRRHLSSSQKADAALNALPLYEKEARERQMKLAGTRPNAHLPQFFGEGNGRHDGEAAEQVAKMFGTNRQYVSDQKKLREEAPELAAAVRNGDLTIPQAKQKRKKQLAAERIAAVEQANIELPLADRTYNVIYADPPWEYDNTGVHGAANHHYSTMPLQDICNLFSAIDLQVSVNAVLFLWVTNPFLEDAFNVISSWGFEYKTNIVWVKTDLKKPGSGFYVRGRHELLLICTRGSFMPRNTHIAPPIGSVITAPIQNHSRKPEEVYDIIERLYPDCQYLELFARNTRDGWKGWGYGNPG